MRFSRKLSDVLWEMAEQYLCSLPEQQRNQILKDAEKTSLSAIAELYAFYTSFDLWDSTKKPMNQYFCFLI